MISEEDISIIEDFLKGNLNEAARKAVTERINAEADFAEHVRLLRDMPVAVSTDVQGFREDLRGIMLEETSEDQPAARIVIHRSWKIAASVAALIGLMWIFFPRSSTQDLYATHFEVPAENLSVRNNNGVDANLQAALNFYNDLDFVSAEKSFDAFLSDSPDRSDAIFFKAVCQLMQNKHEQSRLAFDKVIASSDNFKNAAIWYKGLSFLNVGSHEAAKATMTLLVEQGNNRYLERAQEIIDNIP